MGRLSTTECTYLPTSLVAARGGGAKSGGALPNPRSFGQKTAIFRPKQP